MRAEDVTYVTCGSKQFPLKLLARVHEWDAHRCLTCSNAVEPMQTRASRSEHTRANQEGIHSSSEVVYEFYFGWGKTLLHSQFYRIWRIHLSIRTEKYRVSMYSRSLLKSNQL